MSCGSDNTNVGDSLIIVTDKSHDDNVADWEAHTDKRNCHLEKNGKDELLVHSIKVLGDHFQCSLHFGISYQLTDKPAGFQENVGDGENGSDEVESVVPSNNKELIVDNEVRKAGKFLEVIRVIRNW